MQDLHHPVQVFSVCQKAYPAEGFGGKDSVKENRQGCLSRSIKPFFKLFKSLKNARLSKNYVITMPVRTPMCQSFFENIKVPKTWKHIPYNLCSVHNMLHFCFHLLGFCILSHCHKPNYNRRPMPRHRKWAREGYIGEGRL